MAKLLLNLDKRSNLGVRLARDNSAEWEWRGGGYGEGGQGGLIGKGWRREQEDGERGEEGGGVKRTYIFNESANSVSKSQCLYVCCMMYNNVFSVDDQNQDSWRLLLKSAFLILEN